MNNRVVPEVQAATEVVCRTLGLIAGLGVGAGIFYYRSLVNAHLDRCLSPRIVMVHADVRRVMHLAQMRERHQLAEYLAGMLRQLAGAGADVAAIPAFAPQVCAEELEKLTPLPMVGLLDAIVAEVQRRKLQRLAIFGARVTMETELFGRLRGAAEVVPVPPAGMAQVGEVYRSIVENGSASPEQFELLRSLAHGLAESERVDAILLAGTDLSLVFRPENTDFPHLDGARTHIQSIMRVVAGV
jgi:aspartate racemase